MNNNQANPPHEVINLDTSDEEETRGETLRTAEGIVVRLWDEDPTNAVVIIDGRPQVQRRHLRSPRGHTYDPSAGAKREFARRVEEMMGNAGVGPAPVFQPGIRLMAKLIFKIPRPNSHFVGGQRGGAIRAEFRCPFSPSLGDVDNYVKFVLDALNGVLYHNDRQIHALIAVRCNDDSAVGVGRTEVVLSKIGGNDLRDVMEW